MLKQKKLLLTFIALCTFCTAFSQQTLNVAGHSATINGLQFDYSIGEMAIIRTEHSHSLIVTQGFLQPSGIKSSAENPVAGNINTFGNEVKVYPNPTENMLFVESVESADAEINYQLFDASGKIIISEQIFWKAGPNKFSLDLKNYAAGAYYLMVRKPGINGKTENFSYKIQKTN
jgi:hypothetical protein